MEEFLLIGLPILFLAMLIAGIVLLVQSNKKQPNKKRVFKIAGIVCTVLGALGLVACAALWYILITFFGLFADWIVNNLRGLQ